MSESQNPLEDFSEAEIEEVRDHVQAAEHHLEQALDRLDGDGEKIRDDLAEAYGKVTYTEVGVRGCLSMKQEE